MQARFQTVVTILLGSLALMLPGAVHGQSLLGDDLVEALREGGYVIVMRHASSPRQTPEAESAAPGNTDLERQLDEEGQTTATAMGEALRALGIPIGRVLSSPTYRAVETARFAGFETPETHAELGDRGRSMEGVSEADGAWLRDVAGEPPVEANTLAVTHRPNISQAFPEVMPAPTDGEALIFRPGQPDPVARVGIGEWSELSN